MCRNVQRDLDSYPRPFHLFALLRHPPSDICSPDMCPTTCRKGRCPGLGGWMPEGTRHIHHNSRWQSTGLAGSSEWPTAYWTRATCYPFVDKSALTGLITQPLKCDPHISDLIGNILHWAPMRQLHASTHASSLSTGWHQKVSHYRKSLLNRIVNRKWG